MGCSKSQLRRAREWLGVSLHSQEVAENEGSAGESASIIPDLQQIQTGTNKASGSDFLRIPGTLEDEKELKTSSEPSTLELLQSFQPGARRFIISSVNDTGQDYVHAFTSKQVQLLGDIDKKSLQAEGIGYSCLKGLKPCLPNQDSFLCMKLQGVFALYGVFDGHGQDGHGVSEFVKEVFPRVLMKQSCLMSNPCSAIETAFHKVQELIIEADSEGKVHAQRSGTTATVVFHHMRERNMYIAHVGDSRCVLAKHQVPGSAVSDGLEADDSADASGSASLASPVFEASALTEDHKPQVLEEKARIEAGGGQVRFDGVGQHRVYVHGQRYPGLNMSRCLGDLKGWKFAGLSCEPSICVCPLVQSPVEASAFHSSEAEAAVKSINFSDDSGEASKNSESLRHRPPASSYSSGSQSVGSRMLHLDADRLLLICTDGVWEVMNPQEAIKICAREALTDAQAATSRLTSNVWDRWVNKLRGQIVDDITAILILLEGSADASEKIAKFPKLSGTPEELPTTEKKPQETPGVGSEHGLLT